MLCCCTVSFAFCGRVFLLSSVVSLGRWVVGSLLLLRVSAFLAWHVGILVDDASFERWVRSFFIFRRGDGFSRKNRSGGGHN